MIKQIYNYFYCISNINSLIIFIFVMMYKKDKNRILFFSFLKRKPLFKHIFLSSLTLLLLFFIWLKFLNFYTLHDNFIRVPNFLDLSISKIDSITEAINIRYVIIDSISDMNRPKGIVVNQDPEPYVEVKKRRRIYLTINSLQAKRVSFPNIYDLSLRQAIRKLEKLGLEIGELEYRSDIATNKVLDFKVSGIQIKEGQELYVGTVIDLVVGKGLSNQRVTIPDLIGLTRDEVNIILKSTSLNIGSEIFKSSVEDSSSAIIYKQYPESNEESKINIGSLIDLYFENPSLE